MDNILKKNLILYGVLSGFLFAYLIIGGSFGLGVFLYAIIQVVMVISLFKNRPEIINKKALLFFIPITLLTLRCFILANEYFYIFNFLAIFILYSAMILSMQNELGLKVNELEFIKRIVCRIFKPIVYFAVPLKWFIESNKSNPKRAVIKKIFIGIAISIPCLFLITPLLMSADLVVESKLDVFFSSLANLINPLTLLKIIIGLLSGLYLFGLFYSIFEKNKNINTKPDTESADSTVQPAKISCKPQGDSIIIGVILVFILTVYTLFAVIQIKYLFAGAALPDGLTYAEYARHGFFELLFLSFINIGLILLSVYLLKDKLYSSRSASNTVMKVLMLYLCGITVLLLVSSFYRMVLYNNEYGFTRLRLLVIIFLVFESTGLIITFYYIAKPRFNIVAVYAVICLFFYVTVNIINLDYIIAKNNIDMYLDGKELDCYYLVRLSEDAEPQIRRLTEIDDFDAEAAVSRYYSRIKRLKADSWIDFNLSRYMARKNIMD